MPRSTNISNFHVLYQGMTSQHWHPGSERFAGGDNLMTALENGWSIDSCQLKQHWYAGMRCVKVYQFTLKRDDDILKMPVIDNPYVFRFIDEEAIQVVDNGDAHAV